jgi:hypothetical protein
MRKVRIFLLSLETKYARFLFMPFETMALTCNGCEIPRDESAFGLLRETREVNPVMLRQRMAADGYLYLPGFLAREEVRQVRLALLQRIADRGFLDPAFPLEEGRVRPGERVSLPTDFASGLPALVDLLYQGRIIRFFEEFLGGPIRHFDYTWCRALSRGRGTQPHCDIVYMGRGTRDLFTVWTPFGDNPIEVGGLMILEGSHRQSDKIRDYLERDVDTYCENRPGTAEGDPSRRSFNGVIASDPEEIRARLGGRWLTGDYKMGDVVIFGMAMVHAGLDNQTDRVRLSTDTRYQLASEKVDERWVGEKPIAHGPEAMRGLIC